MADEREDRLARSRPPTDLALKVHLPIYTESQDIVSFKDVIPNILRGLRLGASAGVSGSKADKDEDAPYATCFCLKCCSSLQLSISLAFRPNAITINPDVPIVPDRVAASDDSVIAKFLSMDDFISGIKTTFQAAVLLESFPNRPNPYLLHPYSSDPTVVKFNNFFSRMASL